MANYAGGAAFERFVKSWYEHKGYFVIRSAGSRGAVDLFACNSEEVIFIQCKKERDKVRNYSDDFSKLKQIPNLKNSRKELWVKRGSEVFVYDQFGELLGSIMMRVLNDRS